MELDNKKDIARVQNWASAGIPQILAYTNNNTVIKVMEKILRRQCGQAPTILYIGGHTMLIKGKDTYITADCEEEQPVPDRGVSFQRMRSLLLSNRETNPLLIITDVSHGSTIKPNTFAYMNCGRSGLCLYKLFSTAI
ncbi:hypothetical protein FRC12_017158 [Ceratobasidium sp. 428]|nr:hypothetical protein FRC12_017158 [Ceratobasidium sp. 428]